MKRLILLTFTVALLAACTENKKAEVKVTIAEPKFAYLQEVSITDGFLRGQTGKVKRYYACGFSDKRDYDFNTAVAENGYCYDVQLKNEETWNNIEEKHLL